MNYSPEQIFEEYKKGIGFKSSIGAKGLYEQNKTNERFFVGDQWYGARFGNDRPLVRHNIIKRIGDYKMSALLSNSIEINFSAEGVPNTIDMKNDVKAARKTAVESPVSFSDKRDNNEISLIMSALNDYRRVTADRLNFDVLAEQALRNAYIGGTAIVYTYWDPDIRTGLYADDKRLSPINGDIQCETLSIENVYFGDPYNDDVQSQPYIILATRVTLDEARREAQRFSKSKKTIEGIRADSGVTSNEKVTVLTRLWKEYNRDGSEYKVYAKRVCDGVVIRDKWDIGVRMYPIAKFCWERRRNSAYGDSEITYLIPNQIAINRMITSGVWSTMTTGMPTMVVNGDIIDGEITNDPGQIIKVFGSSEDVAGAIRYISPPDNSVNFSGVIEPLINTTLAQNGAGPAALGDVDPSNTSAIIELKNASRMPLILLEKRYLAFLEEITRIWAEFWVMQYGERKIKICDENGTWYLDFNGERYKDLIISVKASGVEKSSENDNQLISILDKLLDKGAINPKQYLSRMPEGVIPEIGKLINEMEDDNNDGA